MRASKKKLLGLANVSAERRNEIATLGGHAKKPRFRDDFTQEELDTYQLWLDGKLSTREAGERVGKSHQGWINLSSSIAKALYTRGGNMG